VTVPVGVPVPVEAATAADNVTLIPVAAVLVGDVVSVVVEAVLPPPDGACQKSPQPARNGVAASVSSMRIIPALMGWSFIESPFLVPEA
jgi:hypothetical protein